MGCYSAARESDEYVMTGLSSVRRNRSWLAAYRGRSSSAIHTQVSRSDILVLQGITRLTNRYQSSRVQRTSARTNTPGIGQGLTWVDNLLLKVWEMTQHDLSVRHYSAGHELERAGDFSAARKCYCMAVSLEPDNPVYIQAAAKLALRIGNTEDARFLFQEAVACSRSSHKHATATFTSLICESAGI